MFANLCATDDSYLVPNRRSQTVRKAKNKDLEREGTKGD